MTALKRKTGAGAIEYVQQLPVDHTHQLADIATLTALPTRGMRRATGLLRADPVAGRSQWPGTGGTSNGTDTYGNYQTMHGVFGACTDLSLVYPNAYKHEDVAVPNGIVVTASVSTDLGTTWRPVYFAGRRSVTIDAGGLARSDAVGVYLPAGAVLYVRTNVQPASNLGSGGLWPVAEATGGAAGGYVEGGETGTGANVDKTLTGSIQTASSVYGYRPAVVLGTPATVPSYVLGMVGDSIPSGGGDTTGPFPICGLGFMRRAVNDTIPSVSVTAGGERLQWFADDTYRQVRGAMLTGCTHVLGNLAINDFQAGARTDVQAETDLISLAFYLQARGVAKVYWTTCTPKTTSTDSWATTGNQTKFSWDNYRTQYNDWLRAGAPISATLKTPVAIGTGGALVMGNAAHPLAGYFEAADQVETARNSGIWKVGYVYTGDGTGVHPSTTGHNAIVSVIDVSLLRS